MVASDVDLSARLDDERGIGPILDLWTATIEQRLGDGEDSLLLIFLVLDHNGHHLGGRFARTTGTSICRN